MSVDTIKTAKKVVGAKQTTKAVENGRAYIVYLAKDADERVTAGIYQLCIDKNVAVEYVPTMDELGKMSGIDVGAAAVAILKQ